MSEYAQVRIQQGFLWGVRCEQEGVLMTFLTHDRCIYKKNKNNTPLPEWWYLRRGLRWRFWWKGPKLVSMWCKQKHVISAAEWIHYILHQPSPERTTDSCVVVSGESPARLFVCERQSPEKVPTRLCGQPHGVQVWKGFLHLPPARSWWIIYSRVARGSETCLDVMVSDGWPSDLIITAIIVAATRRPCTSLPSCSGYYPCPDLPNKRTKEGKGLM